MSPPLVCSRCGAAGWLALDLLESVDAGEGRASAPCLACAQRVLLRREPESGEWRLDPVSPGPSRLARAIRFGPALLAVAAGYLLVAAAYTFIWPDQGRLHSIPLAVLSGLVAVGLAVLGRGYAGALLAAVVGGLLIAKPFAVPVGGHSLTSETHMNYHTAGLVLVAVAVGIALQVRETLAGRRLTPGGFAIGGLTLGLALGGAVHARETRGDVWQRYREQLQDGREALRAFALSVDDAQVEGTPLPATVAGLDPPPTHATTEVVPLDKLRDPLKPGSTDAYSYGPIRRSLMRVHDDDYRAAWFAEPDYEQPFRDMARVRYLAAYAFPKRGRMVLWVGDVSGRLRARLEATYDEGQEEWRVCDVLVDRLLFKGVRHP